MWVVGAVRSDFTFISTSCAAVFGREGSASSELAVAAGRTFPLAMIGSRATSNPSVMLFVVFGFTTRIGSGMVVAVIAVGGESGRGAERSSAVERWKRRTLLALTQGCVKSGIRRSTGL